MNDKEFVDAAYFDLAVKRRWEWRFKKLAWFDEEEPAGDAPDSHDDSEGVTHAD